MAEGDPQTEKKFVQLLPKIVTRSRKHNFFNFQRALGLNIFWGDKLHIDVNVYAPRQPLGVER